MRKQAANISVVGLLFVLTLISTGCSGANFGSELRERPAPLALNTSDGAKLQLPQDQKFSVVSFDSHEAADLGGKAQGEASAAPDGSAKALANVAGGGNASGTFQLGHAFRNDSDRQVELDITVHFDCAYEVTAAAPPNAADVSVGLKLYARDGSNRLVRSFDLLQQTAEDGAATRIGGEDFQFKLPLGPGRSMDVYVAGQTLVEGPKGRTGAATLDLSGFSMEVVSHPAPPVKTVGDEQG